MKAQEWILLNIGQNEYFEKKTALLSDDYELKIIMIK